MCVCLTLQVTVCPKGMCEVAAHSGLWETEPTAGDMARQDRILVPALVGAGGRDGEGLEMVEGDGIQEPLRLSKLSMWSRALHTKDVLVNILVIT